ncbi:MAG: YkgJ family cysteine cluster protein [Pirellulales bacterium]|nr:YkgJ family cysteine cluster protein [Pirellulales bacterium]
MAATATRTKPTREQLTADQVLCDFCTAKCCRYFALPIDKPTERRDFEFLRWFLLHEHATAFTDDGVWYLLVHTTCKHLLADNRCGIYETRPEICREYTTDNCEYEDDWVYDQYFETAEQVEDYMEAVIGNPDGRVRSRKPALLPILN